MFTVSDDVVISLPPGPGGADVADGTEGYTLLMLDWLAMASLMKSMLFSSAIGEYQHESLMSQPSLMCGRIKGFLWSKIAQLVI